MNFFADTTPNHFVVIPTLSLLNGECECCGKIGGLLIMFSFAIWNFGIAFSGGECSH